MAVIRANRCQKRNPSTAEVKYYIQPYLYSRIDKAAIIEAAQRNSSIPRAYLEMTFDAMVTEIQNFVMNGHSITLTGLGTFAAFIRATGEDEPGQVTAANIKQIKFNYRPSPELKRYMKRVSVVLDPYVAPEPEPEP